MGNLRRTLEHITFVLLAAGCGGPPNQRPPHTGGGCEGMFMPNQQEVVLTEALRMELDRCTTKPNCQPVCQLALSRTDEVKDCAVEVHAAPGDGEVDKLVVHYGTPAMCPGRRPVGAARSAHAIRSVGELLARQAELEAMSVGAFTDLAAALVAHGAPRALVRSARQSAREEVTHAAACRRLAIRHGVRPAAVAHAPARTPTLAALALDNAVEGEVRETWGAAVATWQARTAGDPAVRRAMQQIAVDETRHATLATRIGVWAHDRLDPRTRRRIARARVAAIAELADAIATEPPAAVVHTLGVPDAHTASALFSAVRARVWSAA